MNTERPIREWYDLLPEPERSEANAARDRAEARNPELYPKDETAISLPKALENGFLWDDDGMDWPKWNAIHERAEAGEFDAASEVDRLRARVAELEGALVNIEEYWNRDQNEAAMSNALWHIIETANTILNKK